MTYSKNLSDRVLLLIAFLLGWWFCAVTSSRGTTYEYKAGYSAGRHDVLHANPVPHDLEMRCAGLWIGEQNKKYGEMER